MRELLSVTLEYVRDGEIENKVKNGTPVIGTPPYHLPSILGAITKLHRWLVDTIVPAPYLHRHLNCNLQGRHTKDYDHYIREEDIEVDFPSPHEHVH